MKTLSEIKDLLTRNKADLRKNYGVKEIGVFESYTRSQQRKSSDIDILVKFERPIGFFKFMELEAHLSNLLGVKVDLVTREALKPYIGEHILKEVVYL